MEIEISFQQFFLTRFHFKRGNNFLLDSMEKKIENVSNFSYDIYVILKNSQNIKEFFQIKVEFQ